MPRVCKHACTESKTLTDKLILHNGSDAEIEGFKRQLLEQQLLNQCTNPNPCQLKEASPHFGDAADPNLSLLASVHATIDSSVRIL